MNPGIRTPLHLAQTARTVARDRSAWQRLVDFDPVSRYYARIAADAYHEVWLLTWLPGQGTPWHDHGLSAGSFAVVQGVLTEEVAGYHSIDDAAPLRRITGRSSRLAQGDQRTFGQRHLHRVTNVESDPAVSIHVYSPTLTVMRHYEPDGAILRPLDIEQVGVDW